MEVLPTPGGPTKTKNRALERTSQRMHCKVFQNALLDLFQTVVVTRQHLARAVERIIILRISTPREMGNRLQIGVQHVDIGESLGGDVFQTLQILNRIFSRTAGSKLILSSCSRSSVTSVRSALPSSLRITFHLSAQEAFALIFCHQWAVSQASSRICSPACSVF